MNSLYGYSTFNHNLVVRLVPPTKRELRREWMHEQITRAKDAAFISLVVTLFTLAFRLCR